MIDSGEKSKEAIERIFSGGALLIVIALYLIANFREGTVLRGLLKYGSIEEIIKAEYQYVGEEAMVITDLKMNQRENIKETTSITYHMELSSESGKLKLRKPISKDEYKHFKIGNPYHHYFIFKKVCGGYCGYPVNQKGNNPMEVLRLELYKKFWQSQIFLIFVALVLLGMYDEKIILRIKSHRMKALELKW